MLCVSACARAGQPPVAAGGLAALDVASATDGWTTLAPTVDTRLVFVSSAMGRDSNSGLSEADPKRTIEAGYGVLRDGYPDWLVLRRGDSWSVGELMTWQKNGRGPAEPMVLASYGESYERARIVSTGWTALPVGAVNFFAVVGVHFEHDRAHSAPENSTGSNGIGRIEGGTYLLIEDCLFEHYGKYAVMLQSTGLREVRIRRNVIYDTFDGAVYLHGVNGVLFEENVLDSIGLWRAAEQPGNVVAPQCLYVQTSCRNVAVRGNIFSNVASSGVQLRPGGECDDNLFIRNAMAMNLGSVYEGNPPTVSNASRNVVLDGKDISAELERGWGICLQNFAGGILSGNIIANKTIGRGGFAINLGSDAQVNNAVFNDTIIYGWRGNILVSDARDTGDEFNRTLIWDPAGSGRVIEHTGPASLAGVRYRGNRYYSGAPAGEWFEVGGSAYPFGGWSRVADDAGSAVLRPAASPWHRARPPSVASYNAEVLGGEESHEAFMAEARKQSRLNWRPGYTAAAVNEWVRGGFGVR